eukprot:GHVN01069870.1.p1 GENE.GHVN01069870.1~~GHVN01069870.1.p1  ORF type:complete len:317 (-),score=46.51 GHVN01069870.1:419-1369(-)
MDESESQIIEMRLDNEIPHLITGQLGQRCSEVVGSKQNCEAGIMSCIGRANSGQLNNVTHLSMDWQCPKKRSCDICGGHWMSSYPLLPSQLAPILSSELKRNLTSLTISVEPPPDINLRSVSPRLITEKQRFTLPSVRVLRLVTQQSGPSPSKESGIFWVLFFSRIYMPSCQYLTIPPLSGGVEYNYLADTAISSILKYGCRNVQSVCLTTPHLSEAVISSFPPSLGHLTILHTKEQGQQLIDDITSFTHSVDTASLSAYKSYCCDQSPPPPFFLSSTSTTSSIVHRRSNCIKLLVSTRPPASSLILSTLHSFPPT